MKMQSIPTRIILLCTVLYQVSSEYCNYVESIKNKNYYLACDFVGSYEDLEGVSLIHTKYDTTIPVLKKDLFSPFKNLKTLYITAANVESIEPGAFDGFNLEMLDLYQNKLRTIKNGTFTSLNSLKYLDLSHNKFESLRSYAFTGLTSLEWLSLNSNHLNRINRGTFNHMKNLRALYLHSNDISELEIETFQNLIYLELLDLSFNSLTRIELGLFTDQRNMQTLFVQHNQLEDLPGRIFENSTGLKTLDVSENQIKELNKNLFLRTKTLEVLKFSANIISEFNSTFLLNHVPNLQEVHLYHNQWKCNDLTDIVEDFKQHKVYVATDQPILIDTVYGIGCYYD